MNRCKLCGTPLTQTHEVDTCATCQESHNATSMERKDMKDYLVVAYVWQDWNLYEVHNLTMCDTYEEAEDYVKKADIRIGLHTKYYIFKVVE